MDRKKEKDQPPIAAILLSKAHDLEEATRIFTEKVQTRPLFLAPTSPPPADNAREVRRRAQQKKNQSRKKALKPKPLSASQRRRLGLYEIPPQGRKYELFKPLHTLWLGYIREILGNEIYTGGEGAAAKLCSADFHGAEVEVVRSGCVSRVGIRGIVVKDSRMAFEVITMRNALKLLPKEGTVFRFSVPVEAVESRQGQGQIHAATGRASVGTGGGAGGGNQVTEAKGKTESSTAEASRNHDPPVPPPVSAMVFEIHGEQFRFRATDRASRKFRAHFSKRL